MLFTAFSGTTLPNSLLDDARLVIAREEYIDGEQDAKRPPSSAYRTLNGQATVSAAVPWCLRGARACHPFCAASMMAQAFG